MSATRCKREEAALKEALGTNALTKLRFQNHGGDICRGTAYQTDHGKIFVKVSASEQTREMFEGEAASLRAIQKTNTLTVPTPIKVPDHPDGGAMLVLEFLEIKKLKKYAEKLGEQYARMHLHNEQQGKRRVTRLSSVHKADDPEYIDQFGFPVTTYCGFFPRNNAWERDWVTFFTRNVLGQHVDMCLKEYNDKELRELWEQLLRRIPHLFMDTEIQPALLHGDFIYCNVGENENGPLTYDAACLYGHHELDVGITSTFDGLPTAFWKRYHEIIPKAPGFDQRNKLYKLFYIINHWNHFGLRYRAQTIKQFKELLP